MTEFICKICNKIMTAVGKASHINRIHNISVEEYKKRYELKKCCCGNMFIGNKKFCSKECALKNIPNNHVRGHKYSLEKQCDCLEKSFKDLLIEENKNGYSKKELCIRHGLHYNVVNKIIGVGINNRKKYMLDKLKLDAKKFSETDVGKNLVKEYNLAGGTLRTLEKKYNISRMRIRNLLKFLGIKIKTNREARNERRVINKEFGKRHPNYGKITWGGKVRWYLYRGIKYQGSWEFKFALWLESSGIDFKCHKEVRRFEYIYNNKEATYCPDFYVPSWNKYCEIKGHFSEENKERMEIVKTSFPDVCFDIFTEKILIEKGIMNIDKKLGINIETYRWSPKTNKMVLEEFLKIHPIGTLIYKYVVEKKNLVKISKECKTHYSIMSAIYELYFPKLNSNEYKKIRLDLYKNKFIPQDAKVGIKTLCKKYYGKIPKNYLLMLKDQFANKLNFYKTEQLSLF